MANGLLPRSPTMNSRLVDRDLVWLQHDLDAAVLFVAERLVRLRRLFERQPVRDDEGRIDQPALDEIEQRPHVAHHVGLTHPERQALLERRAERNLVEKPTVHTWNRDDAAFAARMNRAGIAHRPAGPHSPMAIAVPGLKAPFPAAMKPVGKMSDKNRTWSSGRLAGTLGGPTSANRPGTNRACPPAFPPVKWE